jgi:hypothetical protein
VSAQEEVPLSLDKGRNSSLAVNTRALITGSVAHRGSSSRSDQARPPSSPGCSSVNLLPARPPSPAPGIPEGPNPGADGPNRGWMFTRSEILPARTTRRHATSWDVTPLTPPGLEERRHAHVVDRIKPVGRVRQTRAPALAGPAIYTGVTMSKSLGGGDPAAGPGTSEFGAGFRPGAGGVPDGFDGSDDALVQYLIDNRR